MEATTVVAADPNVWSWLIEQAPIVVVLGIVIYWLAKRLDRVETEKEKLSTDVIKLSTLWEDKVDKGMAREIQILELLKEIRDLVKK